MKEGWGKKEKKKCIKKKTLTGKGLSLLMFSMKSPVGLQSEPARKSQTTGFSRSKKAERSMRQLRMVRLAKHRQKNPVMSSSR